MQHINFIHQLSRKVEPPLSVRQQLYALLALMLLLVFGYGFSLWQQAVVKDELSLTIATQANLQAQLDELTAKKRKLENDSGLNNDLNRLSAEVNFRRQLLQSIDPNDQQMTKGFAEQLQGLANQQFSGLWLTELVLSERGKHMALMGYATKPEYVPRYLQKLSHEPVFLGKEFGVLKMTVAEKYPNTMRFDVRTQAKVLAP